MVNIPVRCSGCAYIDRDHRYNGLKENKQEGACFLPDTPDTYDRRCQLGASRRRFEDAEALHSCQRWSGAIYLGGYAIECSLKALICYDEKKNNFKETSSYEKIQNSRTNFHNLPKLLEQLPNLRKIMELDKTQKYKESWNIITSLWKNDELRYSGKVGNREESQKFIDAVRNIHQLLLIQQGESS